MEIIPAIDVKGGKCVRLLQGREDAVTVYGDDPVAMAARWAAGGATRLHVVNLDGAFGRVSEALSILNSMTAAVAARVQFGGGLRSRDDIEAAFGAGAAKVILGTAAVEQPELLAGCIRDFGEEKIIVALDSLRGCVVTRGWTQVREQRVGDLARKLMGAGVREVLSTDISRDGMMSGPDLESLWELASTGVSVIASGGIASLEDLRCLLNLKMTGAIIGKALYEGKVSLESAIALTRENRSGI